MAFYSIIFFWYPAVAKHSFWHGFCLNTFVWAMTYSSVHKCQVKCTKKCWNCLALECSFCWNPHQNTRTYANIRMFSIIHVPNNRKLGLIIITMEINETTFALKAGLSSAKMWIIWREAYTIIYSLEMDLLMAGHCIGRNQFQNTNHSQLLSTRLLCFALIDPCRTVWLAIKTCRI